jgi:hypothetical protein
MLPDSGPIVLNRPWRFVIDRPRIVQNSSYRALGPPIRAAVGHPPSSRRALDEFCGTGRAERRK